MRAGAILLEYRGGVRVWTQRLLVLVAVLALAMVAAPRPARADIWYPGCGFSIDWERTFVCVTGGTATGCVVGAGGAKTGGAIGTVVGGPGGTALGGGIGAGVGFLSGYCTAAYYIDSHYDQPGPSPAPPGVPVMPPAAP